MNDLRLTFNCLFLLLFIAGLTACSASSFHRQKYTRFRHGKSGHLGMPRAEMPDAISAMAYNDTLLPKQRELTGNEVSQEISNASPLKLPVGQPGDRGNADGNISLRPSIEGDGRDTPVNASVIENLEEGAHIKSEEADKSERKIRRTSIAAYSFLLAFGLLTTLFFLAGGTIFLNELIIVALWFLSPAALVTAVVLVTAAFFKGRKYLAGKKAANETPPGYISRLHMANKILLFICGLAVLGVVGVFLLALSSI